LSTLYIRLPSKARADSAPDLLALPCPFALRSDNKAIERQGIATLSELSTTVAASKNVVLILAASDVTLLRLQVPPLSSARLKAALPNLAEEHLIADPSDCVIVASSLTSASNAPGGLRTIAVMNRTWLDTLTKLLVSLGASHIAALPAQLCLPYQPDQAGQSDQSGSVIAAVSERDNDIDMTIRLSAHEGIGLAITHDQDESAASAVIRTLCALVPEAPVTLLVPQSEIAAYQEPASDTGTANKHISVSADNWSLWIKGADGITLDLLAGMNLGAGPKLDWYLWRWPLALAATVLLVNIAGLNIGWSKMKSESNSLRVTMSQIYKSAYPKESVIIDPIAQIQQKITAAKRASGQPAPDDFTAITAVFGEVWASVMPAAGKTAPPAITSLEYRERTLFVRLRPVGDASSKKIKEALENRGFSLAPGTSDATSAQSGTVVWQIRSAK